MDKIKKDLSIIEHILAYCGEIEQTVTRFGNTFESFEADQIYRNVAAHAYGSISIPDVWDTITVDLPVLKAYCKKILGT